MRLRKGWTRKAVKDLHDAGCGLEFIARVVLPPRKPSEEKWGAALLKRWYIERIIRREAKR